jgi:hypothetical protein
MCPHTTTYVSSYYYMCPHTTVYVSAYYYVCPRTTTFLSGVSSARRRRMCPHAAIGVLCTCGLCYMLFLLYVI